MMGKTEQENDPIIGPVIEAMRSKYDTSQMNDNSKRLLCGRSRLLFHCGLLYRKCLMVNYKKVNSNLCFQSLIRNSHWRLVTII